VKNWFSLSPNCKKSLIQIEIRIYPKMIPLRQPILIISSKSVSMFLSNVAYRQRNAGKSGGFFNARGPKCVWVGYALSEKGLTSPFSTSRPIGYMAMGLGYTVHKRFLFRAWEAMPRK